MNDKPHNSQELRESRTVPNDFSAGTACGTCETAASGPQNNLLERLRAVACDLPARELPNFIGELEAVKAIAWSRLGSPVASLPHDELLSVELAAQRLGVSKDYLYRHSEQYPFTRRAGRKLLFSASGIEKHIREQRT
jgi:excisionase family DNA binding protein